LGGEAGIVAREGGLPLECAIQASMIAQQNLCQAILPATRRSGFLGAGGEQLPVFFEDLIFFVAL
jgi:hypothetical protein